MKKHILVATTCDQNFKKGKQLMDIKFVSNKHFECIESLI